MGTMVQNLGLEDGDFGGSAFRMLTDLLNFSHPDAIENIHLDYFRAGAHAVETNTFGSSPLRLGDFDFKKIDASSFKRIPYDLDLVKLSYEELAYYASMIGAQVARKALQSYSLSEEYDGRPLFVLGSIGPSNWVLSSTTANLNKGNWDQLEANFYHQVLGLLDGGVDALLYETQQDILEVKAAVAGGLRAMAEKNTAFPSWSR